MKTNNIKFSCCLNNCMRFNSSVKCNLYLLRRIFRSISSRSFIRIDMNPLGCWAIDLTTIEIYFEEELC